MLRPVALALVVLTLLHAAQPAHARVVGEIVSVGHNALSLGSGGRRVVRLGVWTPVVVELSLEGQTRFDGRLRLGQRDRDGDVAYDVREVHLLGDSGPPQRYTLYALPQPGPNGAIDLTVELLDLEDERAVEMISAGRLVRALQPADGLDAILDDDYLILEISEGQLGRITSLFDPDRPLRPARPIYVAHATPASTPDRWQGLEAVDCVIWDDADPDALGEAQRNALAEWVRQGGLLLVAGARHAAALAKSEAFGPLLPVEVGELVQFRSAPAFRKDFLNLKGSDDAPDPGYEKPVQAVRTVLRSGPGVRRVYPLSGQPPETELKLETLVAKRRVERGQVIFVAAALNELLDPKGDAAAFFQRVLEIRGGLGSEQSYRQERIDVPLEQQVGFIGLGGAFMLFAMLFVSAYIALATFGSWSFLRSRGWEKHNWSAFAVIGGVAVAISMVAVQSLLGVGQDLHSVTVVDATAGRPFANATAIFGVKTGTHSVLDFWLAENYARRTEPVPTECTLRPMPSGRSQGEAEISYADPGAYELRPATAELSRVPVRATLKQLEGRWRGELRGTVQGSLRTVKRTVQTGEGNEEQGDAASAEEIVFDDNSTITNQLGLNLTDAYVFQVHENVFNDESQTINNTRAQELIRVHRIGAMKDQQTVNLAAISYLDSSTGAFMKRNEWKCYTLLQAQNNWGAFAGRGITGVANAAKWRDVPLFQSTLLLGTALSEYDRAHSDIKDHLSASVVEFTRERCRALDLSDLLSDDVALFVGFAPTPGPVTLCTRTRAKGDYRRLEPSEAWTMYRILIPVERAQ